MLSISACVIAKNEAANIERCLQSIKEIVDEIIVVDTGSTDETVKIAEKLGAKIFHYQWQNDFGAARNYALKQARGKWIIFLDADEYIRTDKISNVRPFITQIHGKKEINAISCNMENTEGVDGKIRSMNPTVRIFRNLPRICYQGKVHEGIADRGKPVSSILDKAQLIVIRHTGYNQALFEQKLKRNLVILEKNLAEGQHGSLTYYYLSDSYRYLSQYEKAIQFAQKAIEEGTVAKSMFAYRSYVIIITCMMKLENCNYVTLGQVVKEAVEKFPHHPEILWTQGLYYWKGKYYDRALACLLKAVEANIQYDDLSQNNNFYLELASVYRDIAILMVWKNDNVCAVRYFIKALQQNLYEERAFQELLSIIRNQESEEIVYCFNQLYDIDSEKDVGFLVMQLARQKMRKVLSYYYHIWTRKFGHDDFGGIVTLLTEGHYETAFQLFSAYFAKTGDYGGQMLAIVTMLLGGQSNWMQQLGSTVNASFVKIADAYFDINQNETNFTVADCDAYMDLVADFALLCDQNQFNEFLQVANLFPCYDIFEKIGNLLFDQRLFDKALQAYKNQIITPVAKIQSRGHLYYKYAWCYYKMGIYDKAVSFFRQALLNGYRQLDLVEILGWISKQSEDILVNESIHLLFKEYSHELLTTEQSAFRATTIELMLPQQAVGYYNDKNNLKKHMKKFAERGEWPEVRKIIAEYEQEICDDIEVVSIKAVLCMTENNFDEAEKILKKGLEINPNYFDLLYNLGYLYQVKEDKSLAAGYYKLAILYANNSGLEKELRDKVAQLHQELLNGNKPLVSIVLLAYNKLEYTKLCVDSIYRYTMDVNYELIVVNNGSSDGTQAYFESLPGARVVYLVENCGPVGGFNAGLEQSRSKYTAAICNDFIFTPNWLSNLLYAMESDDKIGFSSPGSSCISNYQQIDGNYSNLAEMQQFAKLYNVLNPKKWEERIRLMPNVFMARTEIFQKIGYLDTKFYFGEFGDDDMSFRIRRAGYKLVFLRDTFVFHFGSITTDYDHRVNNSLEVSRKKFFDKHGIDSWTEANFDPDIIRQVQYHLKERIKILGINTFCGGTPLQIKNKYKEIGVTDIVMWNITNKKKYLQDLKTISEHVILEKMSAIQKFCGQEKFDVIIIENGFAEQLNIESVLRILKGLLSSQGQLIIRAENPYYYPNLMKLLNQINEKGSVQEGEYRPGDRFIKLLKNIGFKDIEMRPSGRKEPIGDCIDIMKLTAVGKKFGWQLTPEDVNITAYIYKLIAD